MWCALLPFRNCPVEMRWGYSRHTKLEKEYLQQHCNGFRFMNQGACREQTEEMWGQSVLRWGFVVFCFCFAEILDQRIVGNYLQLMVIKWKWHVLWNSWTLHTVSALGKMGRVVVAHCEREWWLSLTTQALYISEQDNNTSIYNTSGNTILWDLLTCFIPCSTVVF